MPDRIEQQFSLDASDYLKNVDAVVKANLRAGKSFDTIASSVRGFNGNANGAVRDADKLGSAFKSNFNDASKSVGRVNKDLQFMRRILETQFVIRAANTLRRGAQELLAGATDFQKSVAEIRTISDSSFESLASSVRSVSDEFNIDLLKTTEGLYQTLSNSVGDTAESLEFLEVASRFSRATNSSLKDSVDLLSGAMNAFGKDVSEAEDIAGVFFTGIERGRITARELGSSFGRVSGRTAALGISFEETVAALAALTVGGVTSSEALTQLGGVTTALTKPTTEMAKTLDDLGFASSEAAISSLGFAQLLREIRNSTDGTSASLAKLFPNVRGIGGELALTGKNFGEFADSVDASRKSTGDFNREKFLLTTATDADKLTKEINKLKNALTVDLGQALLKTSAQTVQLVGGTVTLLSIARPLGPAVLGVGAALGGYAVSARAASLATGLLGSKLGFLGSAVAAAGIGTSIGQAIDDLFTRNTGRDALKAVEDELKLFRQTQQEQLKIAENTDREIIQSTLRTLQPLSKTYQEDVKNFEKASKDRIKTTSDEIRQLLDERRNLERSLESSRSRVVSIQATRDSRAFDSSIRNLDDPRQVLALSQRASQLASQAQRDLTKAARSGDEFAQQQALSLFQRAQQRASDAESLAGDDSRLLSAASQAFDSVLDARERAEQQLQRSQRSQIQRAGKNIESNRLLLKVREDDLQKQVQGAFKDFRAQVEVDLNVDLNKIESLLGTQFDSADSVQRGISQLAEQANDLRREEAKAAANIREQSALRSSLQDVEPILQRIEELADNRGLIFGSTEGQAILADAFVADFRRISEQATITQADIEALSKLGGQAAGAAGGFGLTPSLNFALDEAGGFIQQLNKIRELQEQPINSGASQQLKDLESTLRQFNPADSLNSAVGPAQSIEDSLKSGAAALDQALSSGSQFRAQTQALGGRIRGFQSGGFARGTDTVPTMLTPGEFVMNAKSSQRFFTQLQAMNAGIEPQFRQEGGGVTVNGDINVTNHANTVDANMNGKQIAQALNREIRRGTVRLRN